MAFESPTDSSASFVHLVMFSAVWRSASALAGDQTNECFLHYPCLRDAVCIDAKEAHPAVGPQVTSDAWLDTRFDEADHNDEVVLKSSV